MRRPRFVSGPVLGSRAVLLVSAVLAGTVPVAVAQHQESSRSAQIVRGISTHTGGHHRVRHHARASGHSHRFHPVYNSIAAETPWDFGYLDLRAFSPANAISPAASQHAESVQPQQDERRPAYGAPAANDAPAPPAESAATPTAIAAEPELRLIFRDGHQQSIRNYVLTGKTLIVLDHATSGRQQRISLTDLDITATEQAAEDAGLEFSPPA